MKKVFACIDGSSSAPWVCDWAVWSATRLDVPLEFLHVLDRHPEHASVQDFSGSLGWDAQESLMQELTTLDEQRSKIAVDQGRKLLEMAKARAAAGGLTQSDARQRHGALLESLLEMEPQVRLAVLGPHSHDRTLPRIHLDHHVEKVVRTLHTPVLLANGAFNPPQRFAIAFDGSGTARKMVQTVASSPLLRGLRCHIVMASEGTPQANAHVDWAHSALAQQGFAANVAIVDGHPEEVLHAYTKQHEIDLLVLGAYGHSRIRELIVGSTTTTMLRTSTVPVCILR